MTLPLGAVRFATPFALPSPDQLGEAVVVLDIGFCATSGGSENPRSFDRITLPFIEGLGERLKLWIDHHEHERQVDYKEDARFVLVGRKEHPACPELVTPVRVAALGPFDSVVCHKDFDGIASAAKLLLKGREPYPGCDADARAVDSMIGEPSLKAKRYSGALSVRGDEAMCRFILASLVQGEESAEQAEVIDKAYKSYRGRVERAKQLAARGEHVGAMIVIDGRRAKKKVDRTAALLAGQDRAEVALYLGPDGRLTVAADMASSFDFPALFGASGGMRNRITLPMDRLDEVLRKLGR